MYIIKAIPLLSIQDNENTCPQKDLYKVVYNMKTSKTKIFITRRLDKQILVYSYNRILLINKNDELLIHTIESISKNMKNMLNKRDSKSMYCMILFIWSSRKGKLIYGDINHLWR